MYMKHKDSADTRLTWLQTGSLRLARVHFYLIAVYAAYIIVSDAWNLVTRELVWQRWAIAGVMLIITTAVWFAARSTVRTGGYYRALIIIMVLLGIALATFAVYTERGMASRGVALYVLPIISSAVLLSRSALFGAAALSTAAYVLAATRYFFVYFNEGYKAELYTTLGLFSAFFFILAAVLWVVLRARFD